MDITNTNFSLTNYKSTYQIIKINSGEIVHSLPNEDIETILDDAIIISKNKIEKPHTVFDTDVIINDDTHITFSNLEMNNISNIIEFCNKFGLLYSSLLAKEFKDEYCDVFTFLLKQKYNKKLLKYADSDYMSLKTFVAYATIIKAIYSINVELKSLKKISENSLPQALISIGKNLLKLLRIIGEKYSLLLDYTQYTQYIQYKPLTSIPEISSCFYHCYNSNFYYKYNEKRDMLVNTYSPFFRDGMKTTFNTFYKFLNDKKNSEYSGYVNIMNLYKIKYDDCELILNSKNLYNITLKHNYKKFLDLDKFRSSVYSIILNILNEENSKISPWLFYNDKKANVMSKYSLKYLAQAILLETFFSLSNDDIIKKCAYEKCNKFFSVRNCRHDKKYCSDECKSNKNCQTYYLKKKLEQPEQNKNK